ncbi:MAG: hypothetical protein LBK62_09425 [Treponema sp.]|jgi:hypothetical protein|nr:hypothetical protein [Treponema sp.]
MGIGMGCPVVTVALFRLEGKELATRGKWLAVHLKEALYSCVYLEEAAKTYVYARSMSDNPACLKPEQWQQAADTFKYYGQGKPPMPDELRKTIS